MRNYKKAFTLVELLVSVSIISIILSITLYNYGNFNDRLALSASVQELVVAIRQAQAYGINVREGSINSGSFNSAYGIYLGEQDTNYKIFIDLNNNNIFDSGTSELVQTVELRNGVRINRICNVSTCPAPGISSMAINFLRPNPDARIYFINSSGFVDSGPLSYGRIQVTSPLGRHLNVVIENTGHVFIQ